LVVSKAEGLNSLVKAVQQLMGTTGLIQGQAEADGQPTQGTALE